MGANSSLPERTQASARSAFARLSQAYVVSDGELSARDKKKKTSKFATLRKKLIRARRHSRSLDYGKALRELISTWHVRDISALVHEYEALAALKELAAAASLARPIAHTLRQDLATLYEYKFCTDVDLIYRGACFPAHRSILSLRSPFFRNLLSHHPDYGASVLVKLKTPRVDIHLFSALLRYLYTDELNTQELSIETNEILPQLAEEFGIPNQLEHDLKVLLDNSENSDAVLVFSSENDQAEMLGASLAEASQSMHCSNRTSKLEFPCHKAILAARSPFFRNLIIRRARSGEELTERALHTPSRIVLDESVISRRYARVLLNAVYQDTVDLSCIVRGSSSMCSLSEVQAMVSSGRCQMTIVDEAMEIYQIGQFLDFPVLSQGCEDIIVDSLSLDNLTAVLNWSSEPHGSRWVHRQAMNFLTEEFLQLAHSPGLVDLNKEYLLEALRSDFLQVGELDVLTSVLKWGEHQLVRRIEEREPNLLSHTAHSVTKKGVKKRDLNDVELRDILAEMLPLVRMDHVIPYNNDTLNNAIKRGLVSTPPSHMIGDESTGQRMCAWVRGKNNGVFVRPRLFTPYYEEAKSILEEQLSQAHEQDAGRVRMLNISSIPDTLYMVEDRHYAMPYALAPASTVDIIAGTIPVPDRNTYVTMLQREAELQRSKVAQRAYSLPCSDKRAVSFQIQLRLLREFGMPDSTTEVMTNSQYYYTEDNTHYAERRYIASPTRQKHSPAVSLSPPGSYSPVENEASSDSVLSDMMPDIAMATSSMSQMHMHEDFELDIGDGSSRHGTLYI
ncbi:BTB/POZ domain-containing protein 7-like [Haliotis rubra]|uniref:BTB/POZ domain-containing protein 7-like n=1 Tax=Haliotis rubra TaxID=36100 RepID=UPI001EE50D15|nr:BTB/POZ domain-containing protein 7-like [Haliotis rubra]XP_046551869.1 BTB/POZ domain-containing protein 7-like [Haliotis rubra]XP_046551870.1 BTB/POZ domain-containing protein 7-like [Haliotis rubra]